MIDLITVIVKIHLAFLCSCLLMLLHVLLCSICWILDSSFWGCKKHICEVKRLLKFTQKNRYNKKKRNNQVWRFIIQAVLSKVRSRLVLLLLIPITVFLWKAGKKLLINFKNSFSKNIFFVKKLFWYKPHTLGSYKNQAFWKLENVPYNLVLVNLKYHHNLFS